MTTASPGFGLAAPRDASHPHLLDRLLRHRVTDRQERHRARVEHRRQLHDLHERELQHDPRALRALHALDAGGMRPFIVT
ncbi:hypothetical protein [Demequina phytophila]|uniref:hypothetical protein n=1 Tax=Demequina phytophila TaxID=1638981 RepID=UPI0009E3F76D|nr:hypothetical protein [Demequina phytophila]